ncbi:hypothetical protein ACFQJD_11215 [Haloplanus sp. GCM10025708]|uniref:hypothetical protein n=1 Tax=Haloplanus sp. GCM10025708 TaxID=3252679 RepID=UPI003621F822
MQTESELVTAVKADFLRLLTAWRGLLFSVNSTDHPVRTRWRPRTTGTVSLSGCGAHWDPC